MKNWDWKNRVVEYFTFSLKERWAVLILVLLILLFLFVPHFFQTPGIPIIVEDSLVRKTIAEIDSASTKRYKKNFPEYKERKTTQIRGERFYFDPNTISAADWVKLGVKEKTAYTICKYRDKGGKFRSPADLEKIYGLPPDLVKELQPFVRIVPTNTESRKNFQPYLKKAQPEVLINEADSLDWEALPGIGSKLASRIVHFRNRLGGFYAINQVAEVYGLHDSIFKKIEPLLRLDNTPLQLVSINSATIDELALHPYIRRPIANAIVQYRTVHGRFQQLEDLQKIHLLGPEEFARIGRYCKLE